MKYAVIFVLFSILGVLTGCGDTVSQSSTGGGNNCNSHDGSCAITIETEAEKEAGAVKIYTDDDPTCSIESREAGRC